MTPVGSVGSASLSAIALSGLAAASLRLDVAAHNIANSGTAGFVPAHVIDSELHGGGVGSVIATDRRQNQGQSPDAAGDESRGPEQSAAEARLPWGPSLTDIDPPSATNPVTEVVNALLAKAAFVASLRVLGHDSAMSRRLLELLG
jgi:hypothetical protein